MDTGLPEMLHYLNSKSEWQQEQSGQHPPLTYFNGGEQLTFLGLNCDQGLCELVVNGATKPDPGIRLLNGCSEFEMSSTLPRTDSCPTNAATGKQSCKKRKADKTQNLKVEEEEKSKEKKMEGCASDAEQNSICKSTITTVCTSTNTNRRGSSANAKQSSKVNEAPRTDYIHVRARRGQATDSHSLAERVRREKISERMKYLQDLVPGCNKVIGKAGMLDEIINYVQSLQTQVEFLSMKLAAINSTSDCDIEDYTAKEIFPACSVPTIRASPFQFNTSTEGISGSSLEMVLDPMDATLRRTISAPLSIPQTFLDPSSLNQIQHITWEDELQNLYSMEYQEGRSTSFISQPITGFLEERNVKLEM